MFSFRSPVSFCLAVVYLFWRANNKGNTSFIFISASTTFILHSLGNTVLARSAHRTLLETKTQILAAHAPQSPKSPGVKASSIQGRRHTGTRAFKVDTKAQAPPWARHKHKPSESKRLPGITTGVLQKQSSGITPVPQCIAAHLPKTRSPLAACVWPCTLASSCRGLAPCSSGQSRRRICAGVREHS